MKELENEIKELGIKLEEKNIKILELENYILESSILIVLLNWNIIKGTK